MAKADENNPCDAHFTVLKIIHAWFKVGAVPFTKKCLQDVKVRHENREGDPQAQEYEAASMKHTNNLLLMAQQGLNAAPLKAQVEKLPKKRQLDSKELAALKSQEELAAVGLKAGAIAQKIGFAAITADEIQDIFKAKADKLLEKQSSKEEKKRQRKEQIHSQAQKVLASGKDPAAMTKGDLDILLKEKGIKAGADKATSYDLYLNSL